jgi:hypothetical protein
MATDERFTEAFSAYLARNKGPDGEPAQYGISADGDESGGSIDLTLVFKRGVSYCCAEPGCHLGLHTPKEWLRLRRCLSEAGISQQARIKVHVRGIVEEGACLNYVPPEAWHAFEYEETYYERTETETPRPAVEP